MTPLNTLNPAEATQRLTQILQQAYLRRSRQMPANLTEIVATLKADLLKRMPTVSIETVDEAIITETLKNEAPLSPAFFFSAISKHYTPPFTPRSWDADTPSRPSIEADTISLLDTLAVGIANDRTTFFDSYRMYEYLRLRGQLELDAYKLYIGQARSQINLRRVAEFRRPVDVWEGEAQENAETLAHHLAVDAWLKACNTQGRKPSDILTPLANEQQYQLIIGRRRHG